MGRLRLFTILQAGALLATGILNTSVRTEEDAALALLSEYVDSKSVSLRTSAITGLGLAYAGSHREDLMALLLPVVADDSLSMEVISLAALSLGFIFVGSGNGEVASTILQVMMERDDKELDEKWGRFLSLGLALLYLGLYLLRLRKVGTALTTLFFRSTRDVRCHHHYSEGDRTSDRQAG